MTKSKRVTFTGSVSGELAGRLELPDTPPRAYALFAHCFSCSKDVFAASRIAQALCNHGIAVLRFDFTGLGQSDGDFANTSFSSNVEDLVAAYRFLADEYEAPSLLIGHSLGGAAALIAQAQMPDVDAVVTLAAPADAEHVTHNFAAQLEEINDRGEADVSLAGRRFTIRKQFVDDLKVHKVTESVKAMRKALLVLHAPRDETVGIDNATSIFVSAHHPKSFVSLDDADHLITRREDASYAAEVIAAWASRYIAGGVDQENLRLSNPPARTVVVHETNGPGYAALMAAGRHRLMGDQPPPAGQDLGPTPYDYVALALGLCTTQTLRMYAGKKKLDLDAVSISIHYAKEYREDCEGCTEGKGQEIMRFDRIITLPPGLDEATRERLLEIADKCPVHKTLAHHHAIIETGLSE